MPFFYLPMQNQLDLLDQWTDQVHEALKGRPPGVLNLHHSHGTVQYMFKTKPEDTQAVYLSKSKRTLIVELAQRDYEERFLHIAAQQRERLLKDQSRGRPCSASVMYHALAAVYENLKPYRKELVQPYILPDKLFIQSWLDQPYSGREFFPGDPLIFTKKGTRVRSRIERIMADTLDRMEIPYLYEYPLTLPSHKTIYPDFTILDVRERTTVLFEHFGMMNDILYRQQALNKIEQYLQAGFYPGYDLLYTFEGSSQGFDTRSFEFLIKNRFS